MRRKQRFSETDDACPGRAGRNRWHRWAGFGLGWGRRSHRTGTEATTLSDVPPGTDRTIHRLYGHGPARQRLLDLGFQPGRTVRVLRNAPLNDPVEVQLGDTFIALRRHEAERVEVDPTPPTPTPHTEGAADD